MCQATKIYDILILEVNLGSQVEGTVQLSHTAHQWK